MLDITGKKIYLACGKTDMRNGINGLCALVTYKFNMEIFDEAVYIFCNRARTLIKILEWDSDGFWLHSKRLERGHYIWPKADTDDTMLLTSNELEIMISGTKLENRLKKRSAY